jgi:carbamoyltransferase
MRTLGVSAYYLDSAAAHIYNGKIIKASYESSFTRKARDSAFPSNAIQWCKDSYEDFDQVVFYEQSTFKQFKRDIKKYTRAEAVLVDHHKAHAMSSIIVKNWENCAVIVADCLGGEFSLSLGYYDSTDIVWLKQFKYPNSIGLLYSAVTRFLGFTPLQDEYKTMYAARLGKPLWKSWARDNIVYYDSENFEILQDVTRGIGSGFLDYNIAATAQNILEDIIVSLAVWLKAETNYNCLAFSGQLAYNVDLNSKLAADSGFADIAISSDPGEGGCAIGAASLIHKPLWETCYLGVESDNGVLPSDCAKRIMAGAIVPIIKGKLEFSYTSLGHRSFLCVPSPSNIAKLNSILGVEAWIPYSVVCQEQEVHSFFKCTTPDYHKNFSLPVIQTNYVNPYNCLTVQTVNFTKNAFITKVLEHTKQYGAPFLICADIKAPGKPLIATTTDYAEEINNELLL